MKYLGIETLMPLSLNYHTTRHFGLAKILLRIITYN